MFKKYPQSKSADDTGNASAAPASGASKPAVGAGSASNAVAVVPTKKGSLFGRNKGAPKKSSASKASLERSNKMLKLRVDLHKVLLETLNLGAIETASQSSLRQEIAAITSEYIKEENIPLKRAEQETLIDDLVSEVIGLGPLDPLLEDPTINDILINGPKQIFVERAGLLETNDSQFYDDAHLLRIIDKIVSAVGRRVDESTPYVDARLKDGSRFNAMVPPIAIDGALVSIRKFTQDKLSIDTLVEYGAFTEEMAAYLQAAVASRLNIIVSGGTGSGKTTTLNALSSFIDNAERIATIEDTAELQLQQEHIARMETRPANVEGTGEISQSDLLRNALRMRPDRIIVGETRGKEVIDMLQAMNTGHDGSMTTIHANSPRDATSRMENMIAMSGIEMPLRAMRTQIVSSVDLIVQIKRLQDGSRRMVSITEVVGIEGDIITLQDIFTFDADYTDDKGKIHGSFKSSGIRSSFADRFKQYGYELPSVVYSRSATPVRV